MSDLGLVLAEAADWPRHERPRAWLRECRKDRRTKCWSVLAKNDEQTENRGGAAMKQAKNGKLRKFLSFYGPHYRNQQIAATSC